MTTDAPAEAKSSEAQTDFDQTAEDSIALEYAAAYRQIGCDVEARTRAFLKSVDLDGRNDAPQTDAWTRAILRAVSGGKRFRALCAQVGAATALSPRLEAGQFDSRGTEVTSAYDPTDPAFALAYARSLPGVEALGSALEQYQSAALVHDDVIDKSATRRGAPALHIELGQDHDRGQLLGDPDVYGQDGAILAGDLLLAAAESSLATATSSAATGTCRPVLARYAQMAGEVALGQFRDMSATYLHPDHQYASSQTATEAALDIVRLKAARYSVVHPAVLGALCAEASADLVNTLETVLEPAGLAFQLRDDALGAFGDPSVTGKPVGIDIREGKRTVLLALAWENSSPQERAVLAQVHTGGSPDDRQIARALGIMEARGYAPHEDLIASLGAEALDQLQRADLTKNAKALLRYLVRLLVDREV